MGFYCCRLTSRMDWLPSGLILKDPVWITFLGSIWEMAHSISSTRALQAAGGGAEKTHISGFFCLFARHRYAHIPPHLMSCACLAAWLKLRRWNRTTHDVNNRAPSLILHLQIWPHHSVTHQPAKQGSELPSHRELCKSFNYHDLTCVQIQNTYISTFHSTHKFLAAFLQGNFTLFYADPSHSVKYGDVATQLVDRMEWLFAQRPLVAGRPSTSAQLQKGATFSWQSITTVCCGTK